MANIFVCNSKLPIYHLKWNSCIPTRRIFLHSFMEIHVSTKMRIQKK